MAKLSFRRIRYGRPIIIVSGLPRSGTSMMMKMLEAGGMEIVSDGLRIADVDNPKGYYEFERVKKLDKEQDNSWLSSLRGKTVKIISYFLKDLPKNNNYKIIFVERNLKEIISSQNKMLEHRGEPVNPSDDENMIHCFENHISKTRKMLNNDPGFSVLYINYGDMLKNPRAQIEKVNRFLGGTLDEEKMAKVVDPELYRNRA